jgi:hypothetical protein
MEKFKKMWKNLESSNSDQIRERIKETKEIIKDGTSSVSDNWIFLIILKNQLAILETLKNLKLIDYSKITKESEVELEINHFAIKDETNNFIVLDNGDGTYTLLKKGDSGTYKAVETK